MRIKREDLQYVLRRVAPMVKGRTTNPILGCVKIWALNGGFHAMASDGNVFAEASCNCNGELETVCIAPKPLVALSDYGPDGFYASVKERLLQVECGSNSSLSTINAEEFPPWPTDTKSLGVNPTDLPDAIEAVAWAADPNPRSYAETVKRVVWVDMNTKEHALVAMALDGRRLGFVNKSAVVPNARLIFYAEHAGILVEALREDNSSISISESWVMAGGVDFKCAIQQLGPFEMPVPRFKEMHKASELAGTIPREATLTELATMQSLATYEEKVYAKGELSDAGFKLDFVGKTNEFHSVVSASSTPHETHSKSSEGRDTAMRNPNASAGAEQRSERQAQSPSTFSFDAALLHDVLKHTPGQNIPCRIGGGNAFFEGEGALTALALVHNPQ